MEHGTDVFGAAPNVGGSIDLSSAIEVGATGLAIAAAIGVTYAGLHMVVAGRPPQFLKNI